MNEDAQKAWNILEEKTDLKLGQKVFIRAAFAGIYRDDYPFIGQKYNNGEVEYYHSTIEQIDNLMFKTEQEVILVNAIYENVKETFNRNTLIEQIKYTFKLLGIDSAWTE